VVSRPALALVVLAAAAVLSGGAWATASGEFEASLERRLVGTDEPFELVLEAGAVAPGEWPDLTPLDALFDVLSTSRDAYLESDGGQPELRTRWVVTLVARRPGEYRIPPLALGARRSNAITVRVAAGAGSRVSGTLPEIFLEAEVEPEEPYVQSQTLYTVRLFHALDIRQGSLSEPKLAAGIVERLSPDVEFDVRRNGRLYRVLERRYALLPQASGPLPLDPPVFDGQVFERSGGSGQGFLGRRGLFSADPFGSLFHPTRPVRVRGPALALEVRPRPAGASPGPWLPAESLALEESWSSELFELRAGEPVTRTLTLVAHGLTGAQLPKLELETPPGVQLYPDRTEVKTETDDLELVGRRVQRVALVPTEPGVVALPGLSVTWWDTAADAPRTAALPARTLTVLPAPGAASGEPTQPSAVQDAILTPGWRLLAFALAAAWLATALLWLNERRARTRAAAVGASGERPPTSGARRRDLDRACAADDPAAARDALLALAAEPWPEDPPRTLLALAARLDDEEARAAVAALDRALYAGAETWRGEALRRAFRGQLRSPQAARAGARDGPLPDLYPRR